MTDLSLADSKTLLLLDTSTPQATVCLAVGDRVVAAAAREVTTHSEGLLSLIDEVLGGRGVDTLDAIAVGRGPGSFTGLRIGMATAKGLSFAADKPLLCVSTLAALIEGGRRCSGIASASTIPMVAILDARRGEVFYALARPGDVPDERVARPEALVERLIDEGFASAPLGMVGDGALRYGEIFRAGLSGVEIPDGACHVMRAEYLLPGALAMLRAGELGDLATAAPVYLRAPDIHKPKPKIPKIPKTPKNAGSRRGEARRSGDRSEAAKASPSPSPELLGEVDSVLGDLGIDDPVIGDPIIGDLGIGVDRESGLRLDREGRWWHDERLVEHPGVARAFHRWLDRLDDGRYILRLDASRYCFVDVVDAPFVVRTLEREGEGAGVHVFLLLSDESREELDYGSLRTGEDDALYCTVKAGLSARFSRQAQALIADLIDESPSGFLIRAAGKQFLIGGGSLA
ncbi:MAG: tRNA (adenosine(37)-N6)-threonylcarbamoyltransferase complex dimerization subunit type 1 TsaB [Deltaproteobacteria bacterium]|nr:tRNA (adenosine(37)-N6)-threonylcarbamoyltransferase complex dimerization subunit type 1 TsaB [Deltaproteobacteria bacterium]